MDINFICIDGSSYPVVFSIKAVLKKIAKLTGKYLHWNTFVNKIADYWPERSSKQVVKQNSWTTVNDRICIDQTCIVFPHNDYWKIVIEIREFPRSLQETFYGFSRNPKCSAKYFSRHWKSQENSCSVTA